jgi:hypothetical protein
MVCDKYKETLIEAAATGDALAGDVQEHVRVCASCREMLASQQSLFSSVDAGVRYRVNVPVPTNFDHRMRAALQTQAPQSRWRYSWVLTAGTLGAAAAILIAFLLARPVKHGVNGTGTNVVVESKLPERPSPAVARNDDLNDARYSLRRGSARRALLRAGVPDAEGLKSVVERNAALEILVPKGQEELLAKYMEQSVARRRPLSITANLQYEPQMKPMEVPPVEISKLIVSPLPDLSSK